jgi:radical SAM superfamily enzyme YgiQ (UPF0313 family)
MVVIRLVQARSTCPPIGLAYLASSLRHSGHEVEVIDAVGENILQILPSEDGRDFFHGLTIDETVEKVNPDTDYIGVSCMFSIEWPYARQVLRKLRQKFPDKPIIIGGEHVTATADWIFDVHPEVDYCVLGEGENSLVQLIGKLEAGETATDVKGVLSKTSSRKPKRVGPVDRYLMDLRIKVVDDIPLPAWDLLPIQNYLDNGFGYGIDNGRNMPMLATRGCPYQCTFCSSPQMWSTQWTARDPVRVLDEMELYIQKYGAENFSFYDLTAIVKKSWIVQFCNLVLERGTEFTWQLPSGTRSEAIDSEVAGLLYATGCRHMHFAPESGSERTLKRIKKKVDLKAMKRSMRSCMENGLVVKCNHIIGFPGETHTDIWKTMKWLVELVVLGVHEITLSMYIPYPGTENFDELKNSGRIDAFSDEYFDLLATRGNFLESKSFSEHVSDKAIQFYILFGGTVMYLMVSCLLRPQRLVKSIFNVVTKRKDESRLEGTIRAVFGGRLFRNLISSNRKIPYLASRSKHS